MAGAAASSRSFAAACALAVLLAGCLAATAADARRLLVTAMPPGSVAAGMAPAPAPEPGADPAGRMLLDARRLLVTAMPPGTAADMDMAPAQAPAPESGADRAGRMLLEGRELLDGGLRLAGRLLLGLGL